MDKNRILIVDDEEDLVKMVTFRLKAAGYEVSSAYDGPRALEAARSQKPDLIVLDLMLPKMDGYKVCGLLKADSRYKKIPIIILTARVQEQDERMSREVGADAYITKPFKFQALFERIQEFLGPNAKEPLGPDAK